MNTVFKRKPTYEDHLQTNDQQRHTRCWHRPYFQVLCNMQSYLPKGNAPPFTPGNIFQFHFHDMYPSFENFLLFAGFWALQMPAISP